MSLLSRISGPASTSAGPSQDVVHDKRDPPEDTSHEKRTRAKKRRVADKEEEEQPLHTPWLDACAIMEYKSGVQRLHYEIVAYVNYILPTTEEETARRQVFCRVEQVVKQRFPRSATRLFGSVASGLCLPSGDIDIVVDTEDVNDRAIDKGNTLYELRSLLMRSGITHQVQVNHHAKVPILLFNTTPEFGSLHVDLGINNVDGPQVVPVVKAYLATMPALRPLVMVVKGFLAQRKLGSAASSGLGSYAATCMAISFLQLNPGRRARDLIDRPMEMEALGTLLLDFFSYYGSAFPYETSCISVTGGRLVPKADAEWITNTQPRGLAIQCLVRPDNDVGKSAGRIKDIRTAFRDAFATLTDQTSTAATNFGRIVAINQTVLEHREHIRSIVSSGRLAAAVNRPRPGKARDSLGVKYRAYAGNSGLRYDGMEGGSVRSPRRAKRMRGQY